MASPLVFDASGGVYGRRGKLYGLAILAIGTLVSFSVMQAPSSAATPNNKPNNALLGGCSSFPPTPCGELQNNLSGRSIRVSLDWTCEEVSAPLGSDCPQEITTVASGGHIGGGNVDADAFEIPNGCWFSGDINDTVFTRSAGWYKLTSLETVTVTRARCS